LRGSAEFSGGGRGCSDCFFDFVEELGAAEGFVEDGFESFLASFDDGVCGVVAEAGHHDDGDEGVDLSELFEAFVAVGITESDIGEDGVIVKVAEGSAGFAGTLHGFDDALHLSEEVMCVIAGEWIGVDDEDAFAYESGSGWSLGDGGTECCLVGIDGDGPDIGADFSDAVSDEVQSFADIGVVSDVAFKDPGDRVEDIVGGLCDFATEAVGVFAGGGCFFGFEELELVE
jgi:hypothetical protein